MLGKMQGTAQINVGKRKAGKRKRVTYVDDWKKIRDCVLERDYYQCRICGEEAGFKSLHVHHVDYDRRNNSTRNLVTLCPVCHKHIHQQGYKPWDDNVDFPTPWGHLE